jgi:hypothetical protein
MEYVLLAFLLLIGRIIQRYIVVSIVGAAVLSLSTGVIAALAGGSFWLGAIIALMACIVVAVVTTIVVAITAISNGFR